MAAKSRRSSSCDRNTTSSRLRSRAMATPSVERIRQYTSFVGFGVPKVDSWPPVISKAMALRRTQSTFHVERPERLDRLPGKL